MNEITIEFEEIGLTTDGKCEAGGFSGTAEIDVATGRLTAIVIETQYLEGHRWKRGNPIVGFRDLSRRGGSGAGHALLLQLEPVIRRRCAGSIADAISDHHYSRTDTAADDALNLLREAV